jgi:hypothetical protein
MFRDLNGYYQRPEPPKRQPPKPRLTPRQEKVMICIILANVVLALVAPIGGATVIEAGLSVFVR